MLEDRLAEIAGQRGAELGDIAIAGWHAVEHVARRSRIGLRQLLLRGHPVEQARFQRHPRYRDQTDRRSEEHTSELQSLMRISYAVSCLTKKTHYTTKQQLTHSMPHNQKYI